VDDKHIARRGAQQAKGRLGDVAHLARRRI
jgi:hypothetical protein